MKFSIGVLTVLTALLLSMNALACKDKDPDGSIHLNSATPVCGEGKDKDGDGDGSPMGFCGEDKDGNEIRLSINGFCGCDKGKDKDGDGDD